MLNVALNYDYVHYQLKYHQESTTKQTRAGFGATLGLQQLLSNHLLLNVLVSPRELYDQYGLSVNYLLPSAPGTRLLLGVDAKYTKNFNQQANDKRLGLDLSFSWGGSKNAGGLSLSLPQSDNLLSWVAKPAVHMSSVLAVVDQKSVLQNSKQNDGDRVFAVQNADIPVKNPDLPVTVDIEENAQITETSYKAVGAGALSAGGGIYTDPIVSLNSFHIPPGPVQAGKVVGPDGHTVYHGVTIFFNRVAADETQSSYHVQGSFDTVGTYTISFFGANNAGSVTD